MDTQLENFDKIHNTIVYFINNDQIKEMMDYIEHSFDYKKVDRGTLRTIIMAIKPIKDKNERIQEIYKLYSDTLRDGSKHGVI